MWLDRKRRPCFITDYMILWKLHKPRYRALMRSCLHAFGSNVKSQKYTCIKFSASFTCSVFFSCLVCLYHCANFPQGSKLFMRSVLFSGHRIRCRCTPAGESVQSRIAFSLQSNMFESFPTGESIQSRIAFIASSHWADLIARPPRGDTVACLKNRTMEENTPGFPFKQTKHSILNAVVYGVIINLFWIFGKDFFFNKIFDQIRIISFCNSVKKKKKKSRWPTSNQSDMSVHKTPPLSLNIQALCFGGVVKDEHQCEAPLSAMFDIQSFRFLKNL